MGDSINNGNNPVRQLATLLAGLTQPDTNTIRTAEAHLKPILKDANNMQYFWSIITDPVQYSVSVRHVSTIVLRKRLAGHFDSYSPTVQAEWQQQVLRYALMESERAIRTGLMAVAAQLFPGPPNPIILSFLETTVKDGDSNARELAFVLLNEMTETIGNHWKDHIQALYTVFANVLSQPSLESTHTLTAVVEALGRLISYWAENPEEVAIVLPLLPTMLQVSMQSEDLLRSVLDVLYDLAYSSQTVSQVPVMVEFSNSVLMNYNLDVRIRDSAALVIATVAEAKPKTLLKYDALLGRVFDSLFQLMQNSDESAAGALLERQHDDDDDDDVDDDDHDDVPTETSMAQGTLDMICIELPTKHIWNAVYGRCLERMRSNDPKARKAGVAGLGVVAEGCSEYLSRCLPEAVPMVLAAATDATSQHVRECACFCLGQMSEHCQPEILSYAEYILPVIFTLLDDNTHSVQTVSCYVLEIFCERLQPKVVRPILDNLVKKLAFMLHTATKRNVQEMAIAAMAATAVAAEKEFIPYFPDVANLLLNFLHLANEKQFGLRGRALECMGHMAIAVGRDAFRPFFEATMQSALDGLTKDSTDLQEFAFAVFANLAKTMKDEMAPALNDLVPYLIDIIQQDEGQLEPSDKADAKDGFAGLDDSDDEDAGENLVLRVRTALLDVKKQAITALGEMAAHCGTHFCPMLEATMQVFQEAAGNWHPIIKSEVAEALTSLIVPSIAAYHNGTIEWTKGQAANTLSAHTNAILLAVLQEELKLVKDEEPTVATKAMEALASVIDLCGPVAFSSVQSDVMQAARDILAKTSPSQSPNPLYELVDEAEGEEDDESCEQHLLLQSACDLVVSFCRVVGESFGQFLPEFLPLIIEYSKQSRSTSDRAMSYGALGEIAQEVGTGILPFWHNTFLPAIMAGLADSDTSAVRNTAFLCGICCETLGNSIAVDYPRLLQGLSPIFGLDPSQSIENPGCIDNAAAAIARMIMAAPEAVTPLDQVLDAFCKALPLKSDFVENETVYKCLTGLMQMKHAALSRAHVERIVTAACSEGSNVDVQYQDLLRQAAMVMQQQ